MIRDWALEEGRRAGGGNTRRFGGKSQRPANYYELGFSASLIGRILVINGACFSRDARLVGEELEVIKPSGLDEVVKVS